MKKDKDNNLWIAGEEIDVVKMEAVNYGTEPPTPEHPKIYVYLKKGGAFIGEMKNNA